VEVWLRETGRHIYRERKRDGDKIYIGIYIDTFYIDIYLFPLQEALPYPRRRCGSARRGAIYTEREREMEIRYI